jgi:hypothetical protein
MPEAARPTEKTSITATTTDRVENSNKPKIAKQLKLTEAMLTFVRQRDPQDVSERTTSSAKSAKNTYNKNP